MLVRKIQVSLTLVFGLLSLCNFREVTAAKILSISFVSSKSHFLVYKPLLHALAERGHEVTIVTTSKADKERKNVRHIQLYDQFEHAQNTVSNMFESKLQKSSKFWTYVNCPFWAVLPFFEQGCRKGYENPIVEKIRKEKFDLIIMTPLFNDCLYGLIHEMNTSTVLISQVAILPWLAETFGAPTLPSFTPLLYYGFTDRMNFWERTINFLGTLYFQAVVKFYYNSMAEGMYRKYVNPNAPSIKAIERNASLVLVNSHVNFVPPRPFTPDIIEVGGMHLTSPQPLPKDLHEFFNGAKDGVILFSMGTFLQGSTMPERLRLMFVRVFARLKQRVLWKWETETMEGLPPNVKLTKWLPQQDVLAHKNMRLFITHGGHGGLTEALYNGVPLVGIPMFGDQPWNMEQATRKGFALSLPLVELSEEKLYEAVTRVLTEPSFQERAKFLSKVYRDGLEKPLDRAVYWVEYVLRYQGATHLRSAARELNFFQYFSLDVIGFLIGVLLAAFMITFVIIRWLWRKAFGVNKRNVISGRTSNIKKTN